MNRLFGKRLTALLLTLVMVIGMVPAAAAASDADLTFKVYYDEEVKLTRSKFVNLLDDETGDDDLFYMEITKVSSDFDDYGYFIAKDIDGKEVKITKADDLKTYYFYDMEYFEESGDEDVDFLLDGLVFYAYDDTEDGTVTVEFTVVNYDEDEDYDGVLEIEVIGEDKKSSKKDDFDEDDYDLVFEVEADKEVEISRTKLASLFKSETKETLYFGQVTSVDSDFGDYGYFKGYYDGETFDMETVAELKKPAFFYAASDVKKYGDEDVDFELNKFKFAADEDADDGWFEFEFTMWDDTEEEKYVAAIAIVIGEGADTSSKNDDDDFDEDDFDLVYEVDVDDEVELKRKDFNDLFHDEVADDETLYYMEITGIDSTFDDYGYFVATDVEEEDIDLEKSSELKDHYFFYTANDLEDHEDADDHFLLNGFTFISHDDADEGYFTVDFTLWDEAEKDSYKGTMAIVVGDAADEKDDKDNKDDDDDDDTITADLIYKVDPKKSVELKVKDFRNLFEKEYEDFAYMTFDKVTNLDDNGIFVATDYYEDEAEFEKAKDFKKAKFFNDVDAMSNDATDYELKGLTFEADKAANGEVVMVEFTMYGDKNNKKSVEGVFIIQIGNVVTTAPGSSSDNNATSSIRKSITSNSALQINVNEIDRAFKAKYPGGKIQYVKLMNVPSVGALYYDYYNTSSRTQMNATNINTMLFYRDAYGSQFDLGKLTYVPSGSNYCTAIVFVAYGNAGQQVIGTLNISVTTNTVSEVYGVTPKNTAVNFPASAIYNAVLNATGKAMASIKLMEMPSTNKGFLSASSGYYVAANTSTNYTYATGTNSISQLKFTPASNYTGSVEIPYMAYDAAGNAIAMGSFSLGVVNSVKKFSDVASSVWCYKYVTELSDASVIGGYADGTFKPNNTITYGAALKLVTLAAGHGEKAPTGTHTFSGYLSYAQKMGWVSGNVNLSGNITRLQIAQLAAKAMGLTVSNLSANRPFTDTADVYVQALNAAGIIEGYFSNGSYAYRPSNTLTRGQVSAIVWRMRNYNG